MNPSKRGFDFEREVKKHFVEAGWGCTRAAHSASAMDLIAWKTGLRQSFFVFHDNGYTMKRSRSTKIPLYFVASKVEGGFKKRVYWDVEYGERWTIVLMQCKIRKLRR